LIVMGLDHDFNLRRLDRFLVLAHSADARAGVVLTKADRCADVAGAIARVRAHLGDARDDVAVVAVDGRAPGAAADLSPWLVRGSTLVSLGSSGAGKTTLANTLTGAASTTRAVRVGDERGQHTTTVRTLHRIEGGACLIDTPGLRQLWLDADAETLNGAFPEIGTLALQCRYRDCRHQQEPGCAVRAQVPAERLVSFQKLLREANRESADVFQRRRQLSDWKQRARDNRARNAPRVAGEDR
jgi:ribosome biogenesis GTPase